MMRDQVRKARKAFDRNRPTPATKCQRCGMTQEEHNALGKSSLQIHHVQPISKVGMAANNPKNYKTLCRWCHREWHVFWEEAGLNWEEFWEAEPFRNKLLINYKGKTTDGSKDSRGGATM